MPTSEELDLGLGDIEVQTIPEPKSKKKGKTGDDAKVEAPVKAAKKDDKSDWITILIDDVPGLKKNYEVVGVNGKVYQIKRNVPTLVPPEVVATLKTCVLTHVEQKFDQASGEYIDIERNFSAVPWRRV